MDTRTCRLWCVYFCCMSLNAWPKSVIHHRKYTKQHGACDAGQLSSDYRLCHYSRYRATSARLADGVGIDKHVLEWSVGPRIDMLWTACLHRSCSSRLPFGRFVFFETFFFLHYLQFFWDTFFFIKNNYVVKDLCTYFGVISMWERSILPDSNPEKENLSLTSSVLSSLLFTFLRHFTLYRNSVFFLL